MNNAPAVCGFGSALQFQNKKNKITKQLTEIQGYCLFFVPAREKAVKAFLVGFACMHPSFCTKG